VTASTTTTIRGVSYYSRHGARQADVFDIALSSEGITIQRPGRNEQHMSWARISEWELEERPDGVLLILRGGSFTPLMVKGWTLEDLETVIREAAAPESTGALAAPVGSRSTTAPPVQPRAARRQAALRPERRPWKLLLTVALLGALAAAVTVVLLQSAGVISWSFLGPVA
jgi:hypothetical protein